MPSPCGTPLFAAVPRGTVLRGLVLRHIVLRHTVLRAAMLCALLVGPASSYGQFLSPPPDAQTNDRKPYAPPDVVSVLPILHVPKGVALPGQRLIDLIDRHVKWSQDRYQELLGTTFTVASPTLVYRGRYTVQQYESFENKVGAHITSQHLTALGVNRFNCPFVLLHLFHHPDQDWPSGRAGSMNGGFNTGGGTVLIATKHFTDRPNGQSTLQHELGHAFGLPHIDAYGYPLRGDSESIMSYNRKHHTRGLAPSRTPGGLIPEDLRGLAMNDRVFAKLSFDPKRDIPNGYRICPTIHSNGAGIYPSHPDYAIEVSTDSGSTNGSRVQNVVLGKISASRDLGLDPKTRKQIITFHAGNMWHSDTIENTATLNLTFPFPVRLSGVRIYSGHSGKYHPVKSARIFANLPNARNESLTDKEFQSQNETLNFDSTEAVSWRIELTPGTSQKIVIRGLRFNSEGTEIFPPGIVMPE